MSAPELRDLIAGARRVYHLGGDIGSRDAMRWVPPEVDPNEPEEDR